MNLPHLPRFAELKGRWQTERVIRALRPLLNGWLIGLAVLLLAIALLPVTTITLGILLAALALGWLTLGLSVCLIRSREPKPGQLAKRVDAILHLPDDLLTLHELPAAEDPWRSATQEQARAALEQMNLRTAWPLRVPRWTRLSGLLAVVLTLVATLWIALKWNAESQRLAVLESAREERAAAADELLKDWEEFSEQTDDPELKKFFAEAAKLKESFKETDPRAAMLAINELQSKMQQMEAAIANESLAAQAEQMAEALEAFEGMGAMSAALRNQNFEAAAREAEKLAAEFKRDPDGQAALRREAAVAEMLGAESQKAGQKGNQSLAQALSQLAKSAQSAKGSVSKSELSQPTQSLSNQFSQESQRQNRGRAASMGRQQLDSLRQRMQGESPQDSPFSSLCQSCLGNKPGEKPGGQKAGTGTTGNAQGDASELLEAAVQESVTGKMGEGDSEIRTTSSQSGSGTQVSAGKAADFSQYAELSQQAIADENLPLAHRRVIRSYFERIRPIAETSKP